MDIIANWAWRLCGGAQRRKNRAKIYRYCRSQPTPMTLSEFSKMALALIEHHEGRPAFPYCDSVGKVSIGIGRNLADRGLSDDEISLLFLNDMRLSRQTCWQLFVNFDSIATTRQAALLSMAFNLGALRLGKFHNMRAAIAADDWRLAAAIAGPGSRNRRFVARLGLAVGGKSGGFAQGLKQRRVILALFGDALHGGFG